ncbi:tetratricopeptide repeat protein [Faecalibacterium hominis (ex Afrizal et al. 2022)]|uniref:tetratricopeptide repeat protein n=1 Tax=Faecalibacterium hominis (ex Afrizal et al. 2022) TaxID=2881265 RepID=UPI003C2AE5B5
MKYIKLFIASSIIEFAQERASLSDFIRSLNDIYVPRGIYFQLTICEDLSNAVAKDRKQAEYNQTIREAQYFYILFGRGSDRADDAIYTIEEFDTALDQFRKAGAPKIYTYFRQLPEGESASKNIRDFMNRLDQEIGHYYSTFCNVDTLKLNMLLELTRDQTVGGTVKVEDGMASLDGHKMFSVADIPLYSKNETVQKLLAQKAQLEDEMGKLALEYAKNPAGDAMQRLLANSGQRNKIAEQLHTLEMDVLQLFRQSTEKRQLGQSLNWRERDALQMIDMGNYEAARTLLEDQTWKKEIRQAEEIIEIKKDAILEYISGQKTLIDTYKAEGNTAENARKVIAVYEDITALAAKHHMEPDVLYDYASFLYNQRQYQKSLEIAQRLEHWYALEPDTSAVRRAKLYNLIGLDYSAQNDFLTAKKAYQEVLKIYRDLAGKDSDVYQLNLANSCNNLAILFFDIGSFKEAEKLYREALKIHRDLAEKSSDAYLPYLANSCNNLATLLRNTGSFKEAEKLYREALKIHRDLAEKSSDAYLPYLANSCNNLADLLCNTGSFKEAEELCREALKICSDLAEKNSDAYLPYLARSCNNLADLLCNTGFFKESEELYREALKIYRSLAEKNPDAYLPDLALSCSNLASLLQDVHSFKEAEKLHREALKIRRDLAEKNPDVYLPSLAISCNNLAYLLSDTGSSKEAEELYREALKICSDLAEKNSDAYLPYLARSCNNLAYLLSDIDSFKEAEELYREALKIRRNLAEENPKVYLPKLQLVCDNLTALLEKTGRREEADSLRREVAEFYQKQLAQQ